MALAPYIYIGVALEPWQQRSTHKARGFTDDINASSLRATLMIIPQTPEPDGRRKAREHHAHGQSLKAYTFK